MAGVDLSIMRLRFGRHSESLRALWQAFHERPGQALTAAALAEITALPFRDVHQRLARTPELFFALPRKPNTNPHYRLSMRVERLSGDAAMQFIRTRARDEIRIAVAFVSAVGGMVVLLSIAAALS